MVSSIIFCLSLCIGHIIYIKKSFSGKSLPQLIFRSAQKNLMFTTPSSSLCVPTSLLAAQGEEHVPTTPGTFDHKTHSGFRDGGCAEIMHHMVSSTETQTSKDLCKSQNLEPLICISIFCWNWHKTGPSIWESLFFFGDWQNSSFLKIK